MPKATQQSGKDETQTQIWTRRPVLCLTPAARAPKASSADRHVGRVMTSCSYCVFYYIVILYSYAGVMCFIMLRRSTRAARLI